MGLWRGTKRLLGLDTLGRVRRDLRKLEVRGQHPDAWTVVWYGPRVAMALFLSGFALAAWAFVHVLKHNSDDFWKSVAISAGTSVVSVSILLVRRLIQGANK